MNEYKSLTSLCISIILKRKIIHFTSTTRLFRKNEIIDQDSQNLFFILSTKSLLLIHQNMKKVFLEIDYETIDSISLDSKMKCVIQLNLNKSILEIKSNKLILTFNGCLDSMLKEFKFIYLSWSLEISRLNFNLEINVVSSLLEGYTYNKNVLKEEDFNILNNTISRSPIGFEPIIIKGYLVYVPCKRVIEDDIIYCINSKSSKAISIGFEFTDESPIESLSSNYDIGDLSFYAYEKVNFLMKEKHRTSSYSILNSSPFIKRENLVKDISQWEGWRIDIRTGVIENKGVNISYIILRRRYLPPFGDTFQFFIIYLSEIFNISENILGQSQISLSEESSNILEIIVNSLCPYNEDKSTMKIFLQTFETKMESLMLDNESLNFANYTNHIIGKIGYKFTFAFMTKLLIVLEDYIKDKITETRKWFTNKIIDFSKFIMEEKDFSIQEYELSIREKDFYDIVFTFKNELKEKYGLNENKELDYIISQKMSSFMFWFLNGGATNNLINMEDIIGFFIKIGEISKYNYIFEIMLSPSIDFSKKPRATFNIKLIHTQFDMYKDNDINLNFLSLLIKTGYLKILYHLNDITYGSLLSKIMKKFPYTNIISSIYVFLSKANSEFDNNPNKAWYGEIVSPLTSIYSNFNLCPLFQILSCQCLISLTEKDKNNRIFLINNNIINYIISYLTSSDDKLILYSLNLLNNLLPSIKDNIQSVLSKNPLLIIKLTSILKGKPIPQTFYMTKIIISSIDILIELMEIDNSKIKENLSKDKTLFKYLLLYCQENEFSQPKDLENPLLLEIKVFKLLNVLVKKNHSIRELLHKTFKVLHLIDYRCFKLESQLIELSLKKQVSIEKVNTSANMTESIPILIKFIYNLIRFVENFISKDRSLHEYLKNNCFNLVNVILKVIENYENMHLQLTSGICLKIFKFMYGENGKMDYFNIEK